MSRVVTSLPGTESLMKPAELRSVINWPCPKCGARPGQKCVKQAGKFARVMLNFHKER